MEFKSLFSGYNVNVITSSEINIEDVDEVGKTLKKLILKAKSIPDNYISISMTQVYVLTH